jgi:hypothetical protein
MDFIADSPPVLRRLVAFIAVGALVLLVIIVTFLPLLLALFFILLTMEVPFA